MGYYELGIFFMGFVSAFAVIGSARNIAIGSCVFVLLVVALKIFGVVP